MSIEGFWNNTEHSTAAVKELKTLKITVEPWESAYKKYQELEELIPLLEKDKHHNKLLLVCDNNHILHAKY